MPQNSQLWELVSAGRFGEAAALRNFSSQLEVSDQILGYLVELHVGSPRAALDQAHSLLQRSIPTSERVLCLNVIGKAEALLGNVDASCRSLRNALSLAQSLDLILLRARTHALLAKTLLGWSGIESVLPELTVLRRVANTAGDVETLVEFHLILAEIEMKSRRNGAATNHLKAAHGLCDRFENALLSARVCTLEANVALLAGASHEAWTLSARSVDLAQQSGSHLALAPALSTLGQAALLNGRFNDASTAFNRMLTLPFLPSHGQMMAHDGLLQVALAVGDKIEADSKARSLWNFATTSASPEYYVAWHVVTRVKWLLSVGRNTEALDLAKRYQNQAVATKDTNLIDALRLAAAQAALACHDAVQARSLLIGAVRDIEELTVENAAAIRTLATALHDDAGTPEGQGSFGNGDLPDSDDTRRAKRFPRFGDVLNNVSLMIDLASYPALLGEYAARLAVDSRAAVAASVQKSRPGSATEQVCVFAVDNRGWPESPRTPAIVLKLGMQIDDDFEVRLFPADASESAVTLLWIERLVKAAVNLREYRKRSLQSVALWAPDEEVQPGKMVVASETTSELLRITNRVSENNVTVLFTGETGTGKELFARTVHESSPRRAKPFIPFNCNAVARDMLDSQLFGYRRGAFTGAADAFPGVIRAAAGGTLFLDEIGELSLDVQPKLLRFLESGEIHPLGEPRPIPVDVRIVAATNANLEQLVADGKFRDDLFYRLNVVRLHVPPLRERREEIPLLAQHFLDKFVREFNKSGLQLAEETMEYLVLYRWPGNVRQLANEMRRLVALAESGAILMPEHLSQEIAASRRTIPASERDLAPTEFVVRLDQPISAAIEHVERAMIQYALARTNGRMEDAARSLGLSRKGLYLKRNRLQTAENAMPPTPAHAQ